MSNTQPERRLSWTQPICDPCWIDQRGNRTPVRLVKRETHVCAYCGALTDSGIYVRDSPQNVPHPRWSED